MDDDIREKILKDLKETGYPLEIETTFSLESANWLVYNQTGYLDPHENKWRPIDIVAYKSLEVLESSIYKRIHFSLFIECKKGKNPWVFYIRDKERMRIFDSIVAYGLVKQVSSPMLHPFNFEKLTHCLHYYKFKKVAVIPFEPLTGGKSKEIFEAVNQVIKSLYFEFEERASRWIKISSFKEILSLLYPVIVFDGELYGIWGKEKLFPQKYLQYIVSYPTPKRREDFLIDIVKADFLTEYLKIIDKELEDLKENIKLLKPSSD